RAAGDNGARMFGASLGAKPLGGGRIAISRSPRARRWIPPYVAGTRPRTPLQPRPRTTRLPRREQTRRRARRRSPAAVARRARQPQAPAGRAAEDTPRRRRCSRWGQAKQGAKKRPLAPSADRATVLVRSLLASHLIDRRLLRSDVRRCRQRAAAELLR